MELSSLEMLKKMNPPFVRPAEPYSFIYRSVFVKRLSVAARTDLRDICSALPFALIFSFATL